MTRKRPACCASARLSADEYFVGESAARAGITITNKSRWEPMVILKHFGPNHPDMPLMAPNGVESHRSECEVRRVKTAELRAEEREIREQFLTDSRMSIRRSCGSKLNFSWSNWGFGMETLAVSAARLQRAGIEFIELHGNHYGPDLGYKVDGNAQDPREPRHQGGRRLRHVLGRQRPVQQPALAATGGARLSQARDRVHGGGRRHIHAGRARRRGQTARV